MHPVRCKTVNLVTLKVTNKELKEMKNSNTGVKVDGSIYESTKKGWKRAFRIIYVGEKYLSNYLKDRIKEILQK